MICKNCGCDMKTKYMIKRVNDQEKSNTFYEATSKKSIVGWIKHLVDNFPFEEIHIINLLVECQEHEEFYKEKQGDE